MNYIALTAICGVALISPCVSSAQEAADSVHSSINLEEVVVVGERAWIEGNKAVFVPTKSEKNLSDSPESLVERMHIPTVIVDRGQIRSLAGENVAIYINGVQADGIDLSTFWPKQTIRVEYIDHPSDPKYKNAPAVLNFVMVEYEVGGVTRGRASQSFPNSGIYNISSKLVYKKMTYGITLGGGYSRDHSTGYTGTEDYRDIYYDGQQFDLISNSLKGHSYTRNENLAAAMNARYRSGKTIITHSVGMKYDHNPGSGSTDADMWSPQLFDSHSSSTNNKSHSLSPQLSGSYTFLFNPKWAFSFGWNYAYSHVNMASLYRAENLDEISNSSRGDTNSGGLNAALQYVLNPNKISLGMMLNSQMDRFSTEYGGSTTARNLQWNGFTEANFAVRWLPAPRFMVSLDPGVMVNYWHLFGSEIYTDVRPKANAALNYAPTRYFNLSGNLSYFWHSPAAAQTGDVLVREDELTWLRSNPALKGNSTWLAGLYGVWMPRRDFQTTISLSYIREDNQIINVYDAAESQMGGVIKTFENGDGEDTYGLDWVINGYFLNNKLSIQLQPTYRFTKVHGRYADTHSWFRMRGNASYTFGNCEVGIHYGGEEKYITYGGMGRAWHSDDWNLSFAYGNGDLNVRLIVNDLFHRHAKSWNSVNAGVYSSHYDRFHTGRSVNVSVTYTIGYGKKVDRNIDIEGPAAAKSAILQSE